MAKKMECSKLLYHELLFWTQPVLGGVWLLYLAVKVKAKVVNAIVRLIFMFGNDFIKCFYQR